MSAPTPLRPDNEPSNERARVLLALWRSEVNAIKAQCMAQGNPPSLMAKGKELAARIQAHHVDFYDAWRAQCDALERCSKCQQVVLDRSAPHCAHCHAPR